MEDAAALLQARVAEPEHTSARLAPSRSAHGTKLFNLRSKSLCACLSSVCERGKGTYLLQGQGHAYAVLFHQHGAVTGKLRPSRLRLRSALRPVLR